MSLVSIEYSSLKKDFVESAWKEREYYFGDEERGLAQFLVGKNESPVKSSILGSEFDVSWQDNGPIIKSCDTIVLIHTPCILMSEGNN